ncbi:unnamed protein product [Lupinus luteus]|uniref:Uncharacterized protein n=1 Tax=Lupinus luteus TaxID=3873 RepID=A0AAV1X7S8_LUPLU
MKKSLVVVFFFVFLFVASSGWELEAEVKKPGYGDPCGKTEDCPPCACSVPGFCICCFCLFRKCVCFRPPSTN